MSTKEQVEAMRTDAWQPAELTPCPRCGVNKFLRSDSGLCERCHAVQPKVLEQWQEWRDECRSRTWRRSEGLPESHCLVCMKDRHGETQKHHDAFYCTMKPFACECGRRFWEQPDLVTHQRYRTCKAFRGERGL